MVQAKKEIIQNYNKRIEDAERKLKETLEKEKQESLKSLQIQTENIVKLRKKKKCLS